MSDPLKRMAKYVRDLLNVPECSISLGRKGEYSNQKDLLIIVDNLAPARQQSVTHGYDGETEQEIIDILMLGAFTVNFYGNTARQNAYLFSALNNTENAKNLQKTHEISVFRISQIANLKQLAGKTHEERYEISVNASYNITNKRDVMRFDEAQFNEEFLFNK